MVGRIRRCSSIKEFEQVIDDLITIGYKVKTRGNDNALLVKLKPKNHFKVFLLTVWFTCGLGNLVYAFMPAKIEDEVMVKIEEQ